MIRTFPPRTPASLPTPPVGARIVGIVTKDTPVRSDIARYHVRLTDVASLTDRQRENGPRVHVDVTVEANTPAEWPDADTVSRLLAAGVVSVELRVADFSESTQAGLLAFLGHAISLGLPATWRIPNLSTGAGLAVPVDVVAHLPAPSGDTAAEIAWRARHGYGLCYWRHGGSFVAVTDVRDASDAARFTLDDLDYVEVLTGLEQPLLLTAASPQTLSILEELAGERLVAFLGGYAVRLPYRLRRWPMPHDGLR